MPYLIFQSQLAGFSNCSKNCHLASQACYEAMKSFGKCISLNKCDSHELKPFFQEIHTPVSYVMPRLFCPPSFIRCLSSFKVWPKPAISALFRQQHQPEKNSEPQSVLCYLQWIKSLDQNPYFSSLKYKSWTSYLVFKKTQVSLSINRKITGTTSGVIAGI